MQIGLDKSLLKKRQVIPYRSYLQEYLTKRVTTYHCIYFVGSSFELLKLVVHLVAAE